MCGFVPAEQAVPHAQGVQAAARCTCAQPGRTHLPVDLEVHACLPAGAGQIKRFQVGVEAAVALSGVPCSAAGADEAALAATCQAAALGCPAAVSMQALVAALSRMIGCIHHQFHALVLLLGCLWLLLGLRVLVQGHWA